MNGTKSCYHSTCHLPIPFPTMNCHASIHVPSLHHCFLVLQSDHFAYTLYGIFSCLLRNRTVSQLRLARVPTNNSSDSTSFFSSEFKQAQVSSVLKSKTKQNNKYKYSALFLPAITPLSPRPQIVF